MIKAVIFDCFGVLITDSLQALIEFYKLNESTRTKVLDTNRASCAGYMSREKSHEIIAEEIGISLDELGQFFKTGEQRNIELFGYILEIKKSDLKIGLLSNVNRGGLEVRFSIEELEEYFDVIVQSWQLGFAKPDVEIYRHTAKELGIEPASCVMIDDRDAYCVGAEAAGMCSILFKSNDQLKKDLEKLGVKN